MYGIHYSLTISFAEYEEVNGAVEDFEKSGSPGTFLGVRFEKYKAKLAYIRKETYNKSLIKLQCWNGRTMCTCNGKLNLTILNLKVI